MRDQHRIDKFCETLASYWHKVPDWRFGQLISNVLGAYTDKTKKDIFFTEDDEMFAFFGEYFTPTEKCGTISVYGASDDLVEIEGSGSWDDEYNCYDQDVIIYFDEGTVLRMTYDGAWKAVVENNGSASHRIIKLIDGDDYYSDLFEIDDTRIINVRQEGL